MKVRLIVSPRNAQEQKKGIRRSISYTFCVCVNKSSSALSEQV